MPNCNRCDEPITFDNDHISDSGKKIPLDYYTEEPHQCESDSDALGCNGCGEQIYFSNRYLSKSGKKIPLDYETDEPMYATPDLGLGLPGKNGGVNRKQKERDEGQKSEQREEERRRREEEIKKKHAKEQKELEEKYRKEKEEYIKRKNKSDSYYCGILGITRAATEEQIKDAYRSLILKYHPDRCKELSKQEAHERTIIINEAYYNVLLQQTA